MNKSETSDESKTYTFGTQAVKRLFKILHFVFRQRLCLGLFILIGLVSLIQEYVVYNIGIIPSGYYKTLTDKDWDGFMKHTFKSAALIVVIAFLLSFNTYLSNVFYVLCRQVLTLNLQEMYFDNNNFYYLNAIGYDLTDNPDQRITQDIDKFSNQISIIIAPIIVSPFVIGYYTYMCIITTSWIAPVAIFCIFVVSLVLNKFLIKPVMNKVIMQEKYEGFFRFKHMHVRSNAESIALQDGKDAELLRSEYHLNNLISAQQSLYLYQFPLNTSIKLFDYIGSIISYLIIAKPLFSGKYSNLSPAEIGAVISVNAFLSIYLISSFSKLVDLSTAISQIAGLTYRVSELIDRVSGTSSNQDSDSGEDAIEYHEQGGGNTPKEESVIELKDVTFGSPSKTSILVSKLSLNIVLGKNLLITGHSSSGKTSIIRIIKGLWTVIDGTIHRRIQMIPSNVFFLSQKPLLSDGSLFHQLVYPMDPHSALHISQNNISKVKRFIEYVDLDHVVEKAGGYKAELNWCDILSPGEAQRLSFVRLFYHQPKLAFLDEATSAVSLEMEDKLYNMCKELKITVVTIGHRNSLARYHHEHLHLDGKGGYTFEQLSVYF